jgi:hypothetical protein
VLINNCRLVGYLRFVARIKLGITRQGSNPQSATIHSTNVGVYSPYKLTELITRNVN